MVLILISWVKFVDGLKASCKFKPYVFSEIFTALQTEKIDLAIAAIIITHEREQEFLFSIPYLQSLAQFISTQQSNINNPQDIRNKRVGVRRGTPFEALTRKMYNNQITISTLQQVPELLDALNQKKIDVAITNSATAKYWCSNNSNIYKLIGSSIPIGTGYGIMANTVS